MIARLATRLLREMIGRPRVQHHCQISTVAYHVFVILVTSALWYICDIPGKFLSLEAQGPGDQCYPLKELSPISY